MSKDRLLGNFEKYHFYRTVGSAIIVAREKAGFTSRDLAAAAGVTHAAVLDVERGGICSLMLSARLAQAIDTIIDAFVPLEALR